MIKIILLFIYVNCIRSFFTKYLFRLYYLLKNSKIFWVNKKQILKAWRQWKKANNLNKIKLFIKKKNIDGFNYIYDMSILEFLNNKKLDDISHIVNRKIKNSKRIFIVNNDCTKYRFDCLFKKEADSKYYIFNNGNIINGETEELAIFNLNSRLKNNLGRNFYYINCYPILEHSFSILYILLITIFIRSLFL